MIVSPHESDLSSLDRDALIDLLNQVQTQNKEMSMIMSTAGHDLRQSLQGLTLGLEALDQTLAGADSREINGMLRAAAGSMSGMLEALVDVGRYENGSVLVHSTDFDLEPLMQRLIRRAAGSARGKGLSVHYETTDLSLCSDVTLFERLIANLLANAIQFTDKGHVSVTVSAQHDRAQVAIIDTSAGIPEPALRSVFGAPRPLDMRALLKSRTMGLGLYVANRIAAVLNHPLDVHSTPGVGSEFIVQVPLGRAPA